MSRSDNAELERTVSTSELAAIPLAERSTVSRNLAVLQARAWIQTTDTSPTGRSMSVTITAAGAKALADAQAASADAQGAVLALLGPQTAATLDDWLESLAAGAH